jgi:hypothetical protein
VAQRCIYGVDLNPLATELSKVSLWLRTLAAEQPLAFLDHHLKTGNSLAGSDIEEVLSNGDDGGHSGQTQLTDWMDQARQRAIEHVMERFTDLLSIDNETLEDIKEMEEVYQEVQRDSLYQHLLAMANVHTASEFGLHVPKDAQRQMAEALRDDSWENIENEDWFKSAQAMAEEESFFHWELEFPVAFYGEDGERVVDAGFDAVIGNPPYINANEMNKSGFEHKKEFWKQRFDTASGAYDIYVLFFEKCLDLVVEGRQISLITPNKFLSAPYGKKLRKFIDEDHSLLQICDLSQMGVFSDVSVYPIVTFIRSGQTDKKITVVDGHENEYQKVGEYSAETLHQLPDRIWGFLLSDGLSVITKISQNTVPLGEYTTVVASTTAAEADEYSEAISEFDEQPENGEKIVNTGTIDRYVSTWGVEELTHQGKKYERPVLDITDKVVPNRRIEQYRSSKLIFAKIGMQIEAMLDTDGEFASVNTNFVIDSGDRLSCLAAISNSKLVTWIYEQYFGSLRMSGGYLQFQAPQMKAIPIPAENIDSILSGSQQDPPSKDTCGKALADDIQTSDIKSAVSNLYESLKKRQKLNLSLIDYLGNYTEGSKLPDIGLFQPTSQNILNATTEDYEKLQVQNTRTTRDGQKVAIEATARYKPENEDEFETDTWGYTETDYFEAFTLADLTEEEAALIEAFVPVAVEDEIGGFSDNATKNISLIDRLKDITLPDIDDVQDDLQRYIETKERADELDDKIEETDQLIDEIVYDLYDLTEEEIEIVEEAANSD